MFPLKREEREKLAVGSQPFWPEVWTTKLGKNYSSHNGAILYALLIGRRKRERRHRHRSGGVQTPVLTWWLVGSPERSRCENMMPAATLCLWSDDAGPGRVHLIVSCTAFHVIRCSDVSRPAKLQIVCSSLFASNVFLHLINTTLISQLNV